MAELVSSAMRDYEVMVSSSTSTSSRAVAINDQDNSLRKSMARLAHLTVSRVDVSGHFNSRI